MTNAQIVALGVRLFSIWLAVFVLRHAPALWALNTRDMPNGGAASAVIVVSIILVAITVALWFFPLTVARKLIPKATLDQPTALPIEQFQSAAFCLLGLWLLTEALPQIVYLTVIIYYSTRPNPSVALESHNYAAIASTLIEFGISLWLLFGAKGLLRLIRWARYAGPGEPLTPRSRKTARKSSARSSP